MSLLLAPLVFMLAVVTGCPRSPAPPPQQQPTTTATPTTAAATTGGALGWIWEHPQPQGSPLAAIAGDATALHAVGAHGAAILSTDGGATWSVARTGTIADLRAVAVTTTRRPGTRAVIAVGADATILRSVDGGRSFTAVKAPLAASFTGIAVDPRGVAYVVSDDGAILRSRDGGATFELRSPAPTGRSPIGPGANAIAAPADDVVVIADGVGVRRSTDGGATFGAPTTPPAQPVQRLVSGGAGALYGFGGTRVHYGATRVCGSCVDAGYETLVLHRSRDGGATWEERVLSDPGAPAAVRASGWRTPAPLAPPPSPPPGTVHGGWGGFHAPATLPRWSPLAGAVAASDVYVADRLGLQVSRDGGRTFTMVPRSPVDVHQASALLATDPAALFLVRGDAVVRSADGGATWSGGGARAIEELNLFAVTVTRSGRALAVGMDGVLLARDTAGAWSRVPTGVADRRLHDVHAGDGDHVVVVGDGGLILASTDGGRTFDRRASGTREHLNTVWGEGATVLAAGGDGVILRSRDHGVTWKKLAGLTHDAGISMWGSSARDVYLVTINGQQLRSTDAGDTWTDVGRSLSGVITGVWGSGPDDVYLVGWEGLLLRSRDHGASWQRLATGTTRDLNQIWGTGPDDIHVGGGNSVGNDGVLLHSTDRGRTWRQVPLPTAASIYAIGGGGGHVFIVGAGAQIRRRGRAGRRGRARRRARPSSGAPASRRAPPACARPGAAA